MTQHITVMKFGGTSVGDAGRIRRTAEIIADFARRDDTSIVAVVSAMSGVTNTLVEAAHLSATGDESAAVTLGEILTTQHMTALESLVANEAMRAKLSAELGRIIGEAINLCRGTALLRELTPRTLDMVSSLGERLSARLAAAALNELKATSQKAKLESDDSGDTHLKAIAVEATELIVTDGEHGQAEPLMPETRARTTARLVPLLAEGIVPIVTGFTGASVDGTLTTLGRGGSDYSATILGAALEASEVIIWTDVDGVMTSDPRLVPNARTLREISYNEAAELAYFGAKVLHPKTLRPVADAGIPVSIRNSFAPERAGTKITRAGRPTASGVKAITAIKDVSLITVGGRGMVGVPGVAAKVFAAAANVRANVMLITQSSSENGICFIVNSTDASRTTNELRKELSAHLVHHEVEHITLDSKIAIVAVVGEKMHGKVGIAGRTFSALGRVGINIIAIAQGSSEYNISFVVEAGLMERAVAAVHDEFGFGSGASEGNDASNDSNEAVAHDTATDSFKEQPSR